MDSVEEEWILHTNKPTYIATKFRRSISISSVLKVVKALIQKSALYNFKTADNSCYCHINVK